MTQKSEEYSLPHPTQLQPTSKTFFSKGFFFLFLVFMLTGTITYILGGMVVFEQGNLFFPLLWLAGFFVLTFNVSLALVAALFYLFLGPKLLPEKEIEKIPKTAVLIPVKDEDFGLYERIKYTIEHNNIENLDYWILSDSLKEEVIKYEDEIVTRLKDDFSDEKIKYRHRDYPTERKQGNIKDWVNNHGEKYKYMVVCDADNILPEGVVKKFVRKAEHPANNDIAIFQGGIRVVHAKTFFSKFIALATESSQKFNVTVYWRIFERSMSVGHANLIRVTPFSKINLKKGIMCHDIWETSYLDQKGYKTVFCEDIISFEEVPGNYLEARYRDSRWARGTMQAWILPFLPGLDLGTRFYMAHCFYAYVSHPVLLFWLIAGFFCASDFGGQLLTFQRYAFIGYSMIDLELSTMLIGVLLIIFLHKLVIARNFKDIRNLIIEILLSTLIALNNVFYVSLDLLFMKFKTLRWKPMNKNPFHKLPFWAVVKDMYAGTIFGLAGIFLGLKYAPQWVLVGSPFLISFILAIPLVYLTSCRTE